MISAVFFENEGLVKITRSHVNVVISWSTCYYRPLIGSDVLLINRGNSDDLESSSRSFTYVIFRTVVDKISTHVVRCAVPLQ